MPSRHAPSHTLSRSLTQWLTAPWRRVPLGTRSLLIGAHQFLLHPACVLIAWTRLYGLPLDPRLWLLAVVHDWGYWGKHDMDGPEGLTHPARGAAIMRRVGGADWEALAAGHSRSYAKTLQLPTSALCAPDKLATAMLPAWLYLRLVRWSGELPGYMAMDHANSCYVGDDPSAWHRALQHESREWIRNDLIERDSARANAHAGARDAR